MSIADSFHIVYDGPALENHEMDVRELAPALVALADLFERTNEILSPSDSKIVLNVKGSFKSGSFGIELSVFHQITDQILTFLQSDYAVSAATLFSILGISPIKDFIGLLPLIKQVAKGRITKATSLDDNRVELMITRKVESRNGNYVNSKTETTTVVTDKRVMKLYKDPDIRKAVSRVIYDPLSEPGINEFQLNDYKNREVLTIREEEKDYFGPLDIETEELKTTETEEFLQIVTVCFRPDNKWRFTRGSETFFADILDKGFLEKVDQEKLRFGKNDLLYVILRARQFINKNDALDVSYSIVKVLDVRKSARQLELPEISE